MVTINVNETRPLSVELPSDMHTRLKRLAAEQNTSMRALTILAIGVLFDEQRPVFPRTPDPREPTYE